MLRRDLWLSMLACAAALLVACGAVVTSNHTTTVRPAKGASQHRADLSLVRAAYAVIQYDEWLTGERQLAEWVEGELAAARAAEEAAARARASVPRNFSAPAGSGECANPVVPEAVAWRESRCTWDAYNRTGCGGRGCLGFYQLDAGHFYAVSPWNDKASGSCYGIDPTTVEGQTECASRLGRSAWGY